MRIVSAGLLAASSVFLTGFTTSLEQEYLDYREKITSDSKFRATEINKCISAFYKTPGSIDNFSIMMNLPKEKVPQTACSRFEKAWLRGKISAYIYINYKKGKTTPEAIRILQGR